MLVGMASGLRHGPSPLPPVALVLAQGVLGTSAGINLPLEHLWASAGHFPFLLVAAAITVVAGLGNGYVLARWAGVDRPTGMMGLLPGAASGLVVLSEELGASPVVVAVLQSARLLLVSFLAPAAVQLLDRMVGTSAAVLPAAVPALTAAALPPPPPGVLWLVLAACVVVGAGLGRWLHVPSPNFLGPFVAAVLAGRLLAWDLRVPAVLFAAALLCLGLTIGNRFDGATARKLGRILAAETVLVVGFVLFSLGVGCLYHLATGVNLTTAVLGLTPGGMEVMVVTALELKGNAGYVLAMQLIRWLMVLLLGPLAVRWLGAGGRHKAA